METISQIVKVELNNEEILYTLAGLYHMLTEIKRKNQSGECSDKLVKNCTSLIIQIEDKVDFKLPHTKLKDMC